jgi:hypothetical protein
VGEGNGGASVVTGRSRACSSRGFVQVESVHGGARLLGAVEVPILAKVFDELEAVPPLDAVLAANC